MSKNTICLWYNKDAEEAARFYADTFPDSKVGAITRAPGDYPDGQEGDVLVVAFTVAGVACIGLNGGPIFKFTEALSLMVMCDDQKEVDYYWKALTKGGEEQPCGWLKDKYGLSWQVVPKDWSKILFDKDPLKAEAAMRAMLEMKKLDVRKIEAAKKSVAPKRSAEKPKKRAAKSKR